MNFGPVTRVQTPEIAIRAYLEGEPGILRMAGVIAHSSGRVGVGILNPGIHIEAQEEANQALGGKPGWWDGEVYRGDFTGKTKSTPPHFRLEHKDFFGVEREEDIPHEHQAVLAKLARGLVELLGEQSHDARLELCGSLSMDPGPTLSVAEWAKKHAP